jgi:energy-coupling factor transporter ATP-binding protein EcfA2
VFVSSAAVEVKPRWLRDLRRFLPLKSQFILTGNVRDLQIHEAAGVVTAATFETVLASELGLAGYADILWFDPVVGFRLLDRASGPAQDPSSILTGLGLPASGPAPAGHDLFAATLERLAGWNGVPVCLVADFASRLLVTADALSPAEHHLFTRALVVSQSVRTRPVGPERTPLFNSVIWIAEKEGDLPDWLSIDNPKIRHIPVAKPDRTARRSVAPALIRAVSGAKGAEAAMIKDAEEALVDDTEGLLLMDLNAICQLARSEGLVLGEIAEAVRRYKLGVTEDAWRKIEREKIRNGTRFVQRRVLGQDHAVTHMLDIVKRAVTGVSGARRGGRPRGVAFLAGPTGVGKTELAKTVTELLFGDESAYIRFDMSEFSAEHADQRLIGAPPGYVGYDVGGELTNAIREKPFSVVLFDEIEKAHPRILDKFLQVLDDGVLTSGRGDRVYFSESLIIFTSNLGIYSLDAAGERMPNVGPDEPFENVQAKVRGEIERHFKLTLGRPEILNRIGDNIIVFDFIRPEIAAQIFEQMLTGALRDAAAAGYKVTVSPEARATLETLCISDLSNGGRGIRNKIETHLINPLARSLFEEDGSGPFLIQSVSMGAVTSLVLVR